MSHQNWVLALRRHAVQLCPRPQSKIAGRPIHHRRRTRRPCWRQRGSFGGYSVRRRPNTLPQCASIVGRAQEPCAGRSRACCQCFMSSPVALSRLSMPPHLLPVLLDVGLGALEDLLALGLRLGAGLHNISAITQFSTHAHSHFEAPFEAQSRILSHAPLPRLTSAAAAARLAAHSSSLRRLRSTSSGTAAGGAIVTLDCPHGCEYSLERADVGLQSREKPAPPAPANFPAGKQRAQERRAQARTPADDFEAAHTRIRVNLKALLAGLLLHYPTPSIARGKTLNLPTALHSRGFAA